MAHRDRREEMRRLLEQRDREGLTYRELAEASGVSARTLAWWAWKLRREEGSAAGFVEVEVPRRPTREPTPIEVELSSGHRLRVPDGFDGETLRRVIQVLASC